jgi:hypothetical protein
MPMQYNILSTCPQADPKDVTRAASTADEVATATSTWKAAARYLFCNDLFS